MITQQDNAPVPLSQSFLRKPIAHRGFHNSSAQRPENSRAAIQAAIKHGYGIELDLQMSKDAQPMVFHDYDLSRLTAHTGTIQNLTGDQLADISLKHSDETIPSFQEILQLVNGRVPLLVELKDQSGMMCKHSAALEKATAAALENYSGDVAVMSFNPHSIAAFCALKTKRPLGLITEAFSQEDYPRLAPETRKHLRDICDFTALGASFISHHAKDLQNPAVTALRQKTTPVLCWTIRSQAEETEARKIADNVTFEGYTA